MNKINGFSQWDGVNGVNGSVQSLEKKEGHGRNSAGDKALGKQSRIQVQTPRMQRTDLLKRKLKQN